MYPLSEVLLVVCATIAACDDLDEIVAWGRHHLDFLRRFSPCHHGIPCERWLRTLLNRVDPILFKRCFEGWVAEMWPDRPDFSKTTVEKGHGRIETRTFTASAHVDWIGSDRRYPGEPRFAHIRIPCRAAASAMRGALAPSAMRLSCSGRPGGMASARCGSAATSRRPPPSAAWAPVSGPPPASSLPGAGASRQGTLHARCRRRPRRCAGAHEICRARRCHAGRRSRPTLRCEQE
jgi:hypothetical protein